MPLPTREVDDDRYLYAFGRRDLQSSINLSVNAAIGDPRLRPTQLLSEKQQEEPDKFRALTQGGGPLVQGYASAIEAWNYAFPQPELDKPDEILSSEQVKQQYGHLGVKFDRPTPRRVAELTARRRQADMHREEIIAASPQTLVAKGVRFGAALMGAVVDPLNIASAFIPVMGEARFAALAANTSRFTARTVSGAASGAVGALAIEPITFGMSKQLQLDYSMGDALLNVALGTFIGAGLHAAGGAIADRAGRSKTVKPSVDVIGQQALIPESALSASPEAIEGAFRGAVAQFADGRPVDVAPIFEVDRSLGQVAAVKEGPRWYQGVNPARGLDTIGSGAPQRSEYWTNNLGKAREYAGPDGFIRVARESDLPPEALSRRQGDVTTSLKLGEMGNPATVGQVPTIGEISARATDEEFAALTPSRNRSPLTPDERAQAVAPHTQSIARMAESKSDFEPVAQRPDVEPKTEFGLKEAEEFDIEALEQIEQAVVEARSPEAPAPAAKAPKGKARAKTPKPVDAYRFIESHGGMQDITGELASMGLPPRRFGRNGIINPNGKHPDKMRELLVEDGYLPPEPLDAPPVTTIADVYDILGKHRSGEPTYSRLDESAVAEHQAIEAEKDYIAERRRALDDVDLKSKAEKARASQLFDEGITDPDEILERIAIESEADIPQTHYEEALDEIDLEAAFGPSQGAPQGRGGSGADVGAKAGVAAEGQAARSAIKEGEGAGRDQAQIIADANVALADEWAPAIKQLALCISRRG